MSSSPTPSQLPNATATTRGAVPHLDLGWAKRGQLIQSRQFVWSNFPIELSDHRWLFANGAGYGLQSQGCEIMSADGTTTVATGSTTGARGDSFCGARIGTKTLIVGGYDPVVAGGMTASAEVFDETTNLWTPAPNYPLGDIGRGSAIALNNGKILVAGGSTSNGSVLTKAAYLYDPVANTWTATGSMVWARTQFPTPVRISPTKTLWSGGAVENGAGPTGYLTSEIYDEVAGTWSLTPNMNFMNSQGVLCVMANGKVLKVSGSAFTGTNKECEVYDPVANTWTQVASINYSRYSASAVSFEDGRVMIFGGVKGDSFVQDLPTEVYDPVANTWTTFGVGCNGIIASQDARGYGRLFGTHNFDGVFSAGGFKGGFLSNLIEAYGASTPIMGALTQPDATSVSSVQLPVGRVADGLLLRSLALGQVSNPYTFGRVEPFIGPGSSVEFRQVDIVQPEMLGKPQNLIQNGGFDFWTRGLQVYTVQHTNSPSNPSWARSGADRWVVGIQDYNISFSTSSASFNRVSSPFQTFGFNDAEQVLPFMGNLIWTNLPYPPPNQGPLTGTLTFTNGSNIVTGIGSNFLAEATAGGFIANNNYFYYIQIASVDSPTQITLGPVYAGPTDTNATGYFLGPTAQGSFTLSQDIDRNMVVFARGKRLRPDFRLHTQTGSTQLRLQIFVSSNPADVGLSYKDWSSPFVVYNQLAYGYDFQPTTRMYWQPLSYRTFTDLIPTAIVAMAVVLNIGYDTAYTIVGNSVQISQFTLRDHAAFFAEATVNHPDFTYSAGNKEAERQAMKKYIETSMMEPDSLLPGPPGFRNCISNVTSGNYYVPFGTTAKWQGSGTPVMTIYDPSNANITAAATDQGNGFSIGVSVDPDGKITAATTPVGTLAFHYLIDAEFPI